jgi:hypothetical protein
MARKTQGNPKLQPQFVEQKPAKTIAGAVAASKAHVEAANKAK